MARYLVWVLTVVLTASSSVAHEACDALQRRAEVVERMPDRKSAEHHRHKWWTDDTSRVEIGLTEHQAAEIEQVWQEMLPRQRAALRELDRLEEMLSGMIRENAEEPMIISQIVQVEAVRSDVHKRRTLMIFRMHRCLTADQRARLNAMSDRWQSSPRESKAKRPVTPACGEVCGVRGILSGDAHQRDPWRAAPRLMSRWPELMKRDEEG